MYHVLYAILLMSHKFSCSENNNNNNNNNNRVHYNSVIDHRSWQLVLPPLHIDRCRV